MISIVVPALNEEKYLPDCLTSLKNQQWNGQYEIIVVDNGSTDRTPQVAAQFGARVIFCSKRGVAFARQAGAEAASSEIVAQVDADTQYPPGWLAALDAYFSANPEASALGGRYVYTNPAWWAPLERAYRRSLNWVSSLFLRWPPSISGANFAYRISAFRKAGGYDAESLYPDQWGIARRLSRFGEVHYDHNLVVTTSARRVAKPFYVIMYEIVRNCCHVGAHFARHLMRSFKKPRASVT
jgi:glycosyltransferase involved in cell wall biosynthesis